MPSRVTAAHGARAVAMALGALWAVATVLSCREDGVVPSECRVQCAGCCTLEGTCEPGTSALACGGRGETCAPCAGDEVCGATGRCEGGDRVVDAGPRPGERCELPLLVDTAQPGQRLAVPPPATVTAPGCVDSLAGGAWVSVKAAEAGALVVEARPRMPTDAVGLSLRSGCGEASAACAAGPKGAAVVLVQPVQPGLSLLHVDTRGLTAPADVTVRHHPGATSACEGAPRVTLGPGETRIHGAAAPGDAASGFCAPPGPVVHALRLEVAEPDELTVSAPNGEVLDVRGGGCFGTLQACAAAGTVRLERVPDGPLLVRASGDGGALELRARLGPPPVGESCAVARRVELSSGVATVSGAPGPARDDGAGSCGGLGGADHVYVFKVPEGTSLNARVTTPGGGPPPVLWLSAGLCQGAERACSLTGQLSLNRLSAGDHYLWVDGLPAQGGAYQVDLQLGSVEGDTCVMPTTIRLDERDGGRVVVSGTLEGLSGDDSSTCGGGGPDRLFRLNTAVRLNVTATLQSRTPGYQPELHVGGCATPALACASANDAGLAQVRLGSFTGGRLAVDSQTAQGGEFTLTIDAADVPRGDECAAPLLLRFDGGQAETQTLDLPLPSLFDQSLGVCGGPPANDAFVGLQVGQPATLDVSATRLDGGPVRMAFRDSREPSTCPLNSLRCALDVDAGVSRWSRRAVPGDVLYAVVDEDEPVRLTATATPVTPGDWCLAPLPLLPTGAPPDAGVVTARITDAVTPTSELASVFCGSYRTRHFSARLPARSRSTARLTHNGGAMRLGSLCEGSGSCDGVCNAGQTCTSLLTNSSTQPVDARVTVFGPPAATTPFTLEVRYDGPF